MKNPENFDGKTTTAFNQWWEAVTMYLGFYPETNDQQKIAWVGTLLSDTALVWHLQRYRELGDNDTWVHYVAAVKSRPNTTTRGKLPMPRPNWGSSSTKALSEPT